MLEFRVTSLRVEKRPRGCAAWGMHEGGGEKGRPLVGWYRYATRTMLLII